MAAHWNHPIGRGRWLLSFLDAGLSRVSQITGTRYGAANGVWHSIELRNGGFEQLDDRQMPLHWEATVEYSSHLVPDAPKAVRA